MFRSKKQVKEPKVEEKKGRFTLKRSKSKKKHAGLEHSHDISDPLGYIPTASVANANHGQQSPQPIGNSSEYAVLPQQGVQARALYEYDPEQEDEIQLKEGDIVVVYERDESGWWTGECRGKYGLFPGAFVELLSGGATVAFAVPGSIEPDANGSTSANDVNATADAQNSYGEPEPLTASSSMASLDGADGEVGEVLSYLEEGLQENDSPDGAFTNEASEQAPAEDLDSSYGSVATAESPKEELQDGDAHQSPESEQEHKEDTHYDDHQEENGATAQPAAAAVSEPPQAQHRTPSSSSSRVATRLASEQQEQQEAHPPASDELATSSQTHPGEDLPLQVDPATYQAWEQERAEWEQHSREWEQSYESLSVEYEATKQEKEDILRQLEELRQAHDQQAADMLALQEQLENQRHITESEKATANELLSTVQRLEDQLQEAERDRVQAQASTLSAEVNAEEISRLHSILAGEEKQRESVERALEEERKRAAELQDQLHNEQRLRAEVEKKLEHANRDVHEKVAKVEDTLMRHLQDVKAQLAAAISARPPSRPGSRPSSRPSSTHISSASSSPSSSFINRPPSQGSNSAVPTAAHPAHQHQHQQYSSTAGPASQPGTGYRPAPPSTVGGRVAPPAAGPAAGHIPRPIAPGGQSPHGAAPGVGPQGLRPVPPTAGGQPGPAARGRGGPPTRGGGPLPARGRGDPMQRPQIPPGSQKPQLAAQPVGPRMIPIGGTARAAVSRPPPGRPRGATAPRGGAVAGTNPYPHPQPPTSQGL